jgi:hypothetical protein
MVTGELFQPAAFGRGAAVAVIDKGEDSTLNVTLAVAEFPALSVAVPLNASLSPSVVTWIGAGQPAIPDRASEQVKVIVAGATTTPCALGVGLTVAVIIGAVLSMFSVVLVLAVCPAASVTVALKTWFAPSVLTVCEAGH